MMRGRASAAYLIALVVALPVVCAAAGAGEVPTVDGSPAPAPAPAVVRGLVVRAELQLGSLYNSNPLQYSEADQRSFLRNESVSRFAIRSIDDTALRGVATLSLSRRIIGSGSSRFSYSYTWGSFSQNPIKNSHGNQFSLRQAFAGGGWVEAGYNSTPRSYLRHLWDADFTSPYQSYPHYRPAYLATREVRAEAGIRLGQPWGLGGNMSRSRVEYNPEFAERSARIWEEGLDFHLDRPDGRSLTLSPSLLQRTAEATDPRHPEIPDSLRADTSCREWQVTLRGTLPRRSLDWIPVEVRAGASYWHRSFSSNRIADVSHHGRADRGAGVSGYVERNLLHGVSLYATARYEAQWTSGITGPGAIGEVASWRQFAAGGGLHFVWAGKTSW